MNYFFTIEDFTFKRSTLLVIAVKLVAHNS